MSDRHQKLDYVLVLFDSESRDQIMKLSCQSHAIHVSTTPASAASLALCQQLRALGLNHLHVSVQLKAHSISFDSNKLALSVTSVLDKYVASFRLFDSSMCHLCFNNYIQRERWERNKRGSHSFL